jgi:hypothetical protein
MDCSGRAILCLRQLDGPAVEMYLRPGAGVLFGESHAGVDAHDQFRLVFGKAPAAAAQLSPDHKLDAIDRLMTFERWKGDDRHDGLAGQL